MKQLYLITTFLLLHNVVLAQDSLEIKDQNTLRYMNDSTENRISVGCGWAGIPTSNIYIIRDLISEERFDLIGKLLDSNTPSTQYLAAVSLLRANKKSGFFLDSSTLQKISILQQSEEVIYFCSGCTRRWSNSLKSLLDKKSKDYMTKWTKH